MKRQNNTNQEVYRIPEYYRLVTCLVRELAGARCIQRWYEPGRYDAPRDLCLRGSRKEIEHMLDEAWPAVKMLTMLGTILINVAVMMSGSKPSDSLSELSTDLMDGSAFDKLDADRIRRFVRFWARRRLEAEAVQRGMEDARQMGKEISFIENEDVRGWLQGRRQSVGAC